MLNKIINFLLTIVLVVSWWWFYQYVNYLDMNHQQEVKQLNEKCKKEKFEVKWNEIFKEYYKNPYIDDNNSYINFNF